MISFVVPAHNEETFLGQTLDALVAAARALGEDFETVVVNDASTDATRDIAERHDARVIDVELRHIAAVRNAGARVARGDVLVFVDADTIVPEATLRAAMTEIERGAAGGGAWLGFTEPLPRHLRLGTWLFTWLWTRRWAAGCFIFARRDAFEAAGGFDERYYCAEELYMSRALRKQGRFVVLKQPVLTSTRRLRAGSTWQMVRQAFPLLLGGPRAWRSREHTGGIWYDDP